MTPATSADAQRIKGFDGLRAIAFLLVFISHKAVLPHRDAYGDVGVWLFFVLSGFLITRILARAREGLESGQSDFRRAIGRFYLRRTARIFPIYYALLAVFACLALITEVSNFSPKQQLAYWLYGTNVMIGHFAAWPGHFGHLWTLAVEEQFYVLLAPLILLLPRSATLRVALGFVIVGLVTKVTLELRGAHPTTIDVSSFVNFALLGLGGVIGLNAEKPLPRWLASSAALLVALLAYVALPLAFGGAAPYWATFGKLIGLLAGLILLQVFHDQSGAAVAFLETAPLKAVGRVSYGAYLFHPFINVESVTRRLGQGFVLPWPASALLELGATLIIAALSWRLFERPILQWAARKTERAPQPAAAAV